jgi:hypothetical protein
MGNIGKNIGKKRERKNLSGADSQAKTVPEE